MRTLRYTKLCMLASRKCSRWTSNMWMLWRRHGSQVRMEVRMPICRMNPQHLLLKLTKPNLKGVEIGTTIKFVHPLSQHFEKKPNVIMPLRNLNGISVKRKSRSWVHCHFQSWNAVNSWVKPAKKTHGPESAWSGVVGFSWCRKGFNIYI